MTTAVRREAAPLRSQVVDLLRRAIVGAEFAPGERLTERVLCERFAVSRTVVREALRQLESEGLVTTVPQRGPVVAVLSAADAASLYEVRALLEALAGRAFAERATPRQREARYRQNMASLPAEIYRVEEHTIRTFLRELDHRYGGAVGWARTRGVDPDAGRRLAAALLDGG
jgi:DNA-binding GntR family transcriptional regulator